jgi:mRNA interferase RelE/StbE
MWRPRARKNFLALDMPIRRRVADAIDGLAEKPRPPGSAALASLPGALRIRIGAYRVLYEIDDDKHVVYVIEVRHRRDVYNR